MRNSCTQRRELNARGTETVQGPRAHARFLENNLTGCFPQGLKALQRTCNARARLVVSSISSVTLLIATQHTVSATRQDCDTTALSRLFTHRPRIWPSPTLITRSISVCGEARAQQKTRTVQPSAPSRAVGSSRPSNQVASDSDVGLAARESRPGTSAADNPLGS